MVILVHKYLVLVVLTLLNFLLIASPLHAQREFEDEIASIMRDLEYLHGKGLDVEPVIKTLNKAIEVYYENNVVEAHEYLEKAKHLVEELKSTAETVYLTSLLTKTCIVTALASTPLVVYLVLPRLYLYLWFKSRRKWIVVRR